MSIREILLATPLVLLALAGCPPVVDDPVPEAQSVLDTAPADTTDLVEPNEAVDTDDQRRLTAWLASDTDHDGLPNGIELDFGLDFEDPTDGPDIDGDGVPNFEDDDVDGDGIPNDCDPDIDGDDVANVRDDDIDGDAIPDELDFDIDADGIRNEWDFDDDSDGGEDAGEIEADEVAAGELLRRAQEMMAGGDDDDDEDEESSTDRFEAYIEHLVERVGKGDKKAQEKMDKLLKQLNRGGKRPIEPGSYEAKAIIEKLADRFGESKVSKNDLQTAVNQMLIARRLDLDATDAIDALFRQATAVKNPKEQEGLDELWTRLATVQEFAETYKEADLKTCSDAVMTLGEMGGHGTLDEKIGAVKRLTDVMEAPDLGGIVKGLDDLTRAMDEVYPYWDWNAMVDELLAADGISEGITPDIIKDVVDDDDDGGDQGDTEGDGGDGGGDDGGA